MSEQLDAVIQHMQELTATVKEHHQAQDTATLDWETLKAQFSEQLETLVATQVQEKLDAAPRYRVPGDPVRAGDEPGVEKSNRYHPMLKSFGKDGYHRDFTMTKIQPIDLWLAHNLINKAHILMPDRVQAPSDDLAAAIKALTSTGTGTGDELVPTDMAAQLWQDFFLASRIVQQAMTVVPMPTNPFDIPLSLGDVTWRKGTENTATTASDPATAKSILTVTELVTEQNWSYTLQEDAVIALMPTIRERLGISGAEVIDAFALNADSTDADTGNINLDDANPGDTSYYLSAGQDGIRHQWLVDVTSGAQSINAGGDALIDGDVTSMLAAMGKYAVSPDACRMACDVSAYLKGFLALDGVFTLDKYGPQAVVLTGELAKYRGIPIIVSESHELAEADGKLSTTSTNNTLGSVSCWNRLMWYAGFRRDLMIEVDRDIQKRQYIMVTSLRMAVATRGTRSSNTHTAGIRNILVT